MRLSLVVIVCLVILGWFFLDDDDDNDEPRYSEGTHMPINCRAYVQDTVDGFRSKSYSADEAMAGLERNCGAMGASWKNRR